MLSHFRRQGCHAQFWKELLKRTAGRPFALRPCVSPGLPLSSSDWRVRHSRLSANLPEASPQTIRGFRAAPQSFPGGTQSASLMGSVATVSCAGSRAALAAACRSKDSSPARSPGSRSLLFPNHLHAGPSSAPLNCQSRTAVFGPMKERLPVNQFLLNT